MRASCLIVFIVGGVAGIMASETNAAPMEVTASVTAKQSYSDNISLAESNNKQEDYISQIDPSISISKETARHKVSLNYLMQNLYYKNDDTRTKTYHRATIGTNSEFIRNRFFLDTEVDYRPNTVAYGGPISPDNVNTGVNRTNTTVVSVSPYLRYDLMGLADAEFRYTYGRTSFDDSDFEDFESNEISVRASRARSNEPHVLDVSYSKRDTEYDGSGKVTFQVATVDYRYFVTPQFAPTAEAGYEDYDYDFIPSNTRQDGSFWLIGFIWSPSERTVLELQGGERVYGSTYRGSLRHRSQRTTWNVDYFEELTNRVSTSLNVEKAQSGDDPIIDPSVPISGPAQVVFDPSNVYVQKTLVFGNTIKLLKDRIATAVYRKERDFEINNRDEEIRGISVNWSHDLGVNLTSRLGGELRKTEFPNSSRKEEWSILRARLNYSVKSNLKTFIEYHHLENQASGGGFDYTENRASIGMSLAF